MRYLIGSGYHHHAHAGTDYFFPLWWENTRRANPYRTIVLSSGGSTRNPPVPLMAPAPQWIALDGDLGHVHDLIYGRKHFSWCSWSISIVTLALLAYFDECDFIFKEQDCLAFGPWVKQIYAESGSKQVMFGRARCMPAVQSLFLVKHAFIPEFVRLYLGTGDERSADNIGEHKFARLESENPSTFGRYSFGYDRDRPFNVKDHVWYAQKFTPAELNLLAEAKLITVPPQPDHVTVYSSNP